VFAFRGFLLKLLMQAKIKKLNGRYENIYQERCSWSFKIGSGTKRERRYFQIVSGFFNAPQYVFDEFDLVGLENADFNEYE
jgi:hypothetical protein